MADQRPEHSVDRAEFLRRTGALGLAGAAALGFPLLESRAAGAAPLCCAERGSAAAKLKISAPDPTTTARREMTIGSRLIRRLPPAPSA